MKRGALLGLGLCLGLLGGGCEEGQGGEEPPSSEVAGEDKAAGEPETRRQRLLADVDRRELTGRLREAAQASPVAIRRLAMLGLARLRLPEAAPLLRRGLRDADPAVRDHAGLGLGLFGSEAEPEAARAVLGALAAEEKGDVRAALLGDLGRLGVQEALPAYRSGLEAGAARVRAGACRGLASHGRAGRAVATELMRRVAARLLEDAEGRVRAACAEALAALPPPTASPEARRSLREDLVRAVRDESPEVRYHALRALRDYPGAPAEALARAAQDPDYRVAVQAFRALSERLAGEPDAPMASALRKRVDRALGGGVVLAGAELHVLRAAFEAAAPFAAEASTHGVAVEAWERLEGLEEASPDAGIAHCAAAVLVDRGRGRARAVRECGRGRVAKERRRELEAAVWARVPGSEERRVRLRRLFRKGSPAVRQAVVSAVGGAPSAAGTSLVLDGLEAEDRGVITAAAKAVRRLAAEWLAGAEAGTEEAPSGHRLRRALARAEEGLRSEDYAPGLIAWLEAVQALRATDFEDAVAELARHSNAGVRARARDLLRRLDLEVPAREPAAVVHPLDPAAFPAADASLEAVLVTSRGRIRVQLWPARAPGTVARFLELVEGGLYEGTPFHHLAPGFVVQGGDPRGDGHGGPGFRVRHEEHRNRFDPGTVGLASGGRDTAGSQFFLTLAWAPQLAARYTAFGRVVEGLEVATELQEGDVLKRVRVSRETP